MSGEILTPEEVATLTKLPVKTIVEPLRRGTLRGRKMGRRWRTTSAAVLFDIKEENDANLPSKREILSDGDLLKGERKDWIVEGSKAKKYATGKVPVLLHDELDRYAFWPQRKFDAVREAAKLTGGPHTLRHTFATTWIENGGSWAKLAEVLGHSEQHVTKLYRHLLPGHLDSDRNRVAFAPPMKRSQFQAVQRRRRG